MGRRRGGGAMVGALKPIFPKSIVNEKLVRPRANGQPVASRGRGRAIPSTWASRAQLLIPHPHAALRAAAVVPALITSHSYDVTIVSSCEWLLTDRHMVNSPKQK